MSIDRVRDGGFPRTTLYVRKLYDDTSRLLYPVTYIELVTIIVLKLVFRRIIFKLVVDDLFSISTFI